MWALFLVPFGRWRSEKRTVADFERRMELLAHAEAHGTTGRWIVTPRKGVRFLGPQERQRARARVIRRRVFVFLLEALFVSLLIGLVPPLRAVWYGSAGIAVLLVTYAWLLVAMKAHASVPRPAPERAVGRRATPPEVVLLDDEGAHVTVRTATA
jgi:hypothetical protein